MGSSKSLPGYRRNRVLSSCAIRESFPHACRLRGTILAGRYHKGCEKNPAAERRHDGRSEAGSCRCRSLHREGSMPNTASQCQPSFCQMAADSEKTYPHGRMQGFGNFIILFQTGTASQDLRQPKLAHGSFHVSNLSLCWRGSPDPLGRFPANTANHVRMSESLGGSLRSFRIGLRRDGLRNAGVK